MYRLQKKNFKTTGLFFLALASLFCEKIPAADHPDLTGAWKLDAAKSDFGSFPGPSSMIDKIDQTPTQITVNRDRAGAQVVIHIPLDGTARDNEIRGTTMKTTGRWEATTLVIDYNGQQRGKPAKSEERWTVSPDGKTMKVVRQLSGAQGNMEQTLTMEKQ